MQTGSGTEIPRFQQCLGRTRGSNDFGRNSRETRAENPASKPQCCPLSPQGRGGNTGSTKGTRKGTSLLVPFVLPVFPPLLERVKRPGAFRQVFHADLGWNFKSECEE